MINVKNMKFQYPENSEFPSKALMPAIKDAIYNIAPEKITQIERHTADVELIITENENWYCEALSGWKVIRLSRKSIEIIWALSYGYYHFYINICNGVQSNGQKVDITGNEKLISARKLLTWAFNNLTKKEISEIPQGVPNIADKIHWGSDKHAIIEITLCTIAFFLHHELAHIKFVDDKFNHSIEEEWACDQEAINVILKEANEAEFNKRAFGVSVGLLLINGIGTETKFYDGLKHPFTYDRLFVNLENNVDEENDKIWGWVVAILALHMTNANIAQPNTVFDNFYQCAKEYRSLLENHSNELSSA